MDIITVNNWLLFPSLFMLRCRCKYSNHFYFHILVYCIFILWSYYNLFIIKKWIPIRIISEIVLRNDCYRYAKIKSAYYSAECLEKIYSWVKRWKFVYDGESWLSAEEDIELMFYMNFIICIFTNTFTYIMFLLMYLFQ